MKRFMAFLALFVTPSPVPYFKTAESWESQRVPRSGTPRAQANGSGQNVQLRDRQFTRDEYDATLRRLDALVRDNDRAGIIKIADELEAEWGRVGGDPFGRAMLEISNLLANNFRDYPSSEKYAVQALSHSSTFSLRLETQLLGFVRRDLKLTTRDWPKERSTKTQLWLHAWGRLEREINRNFNFNDRPFLNIAPPSETGLPAGVSPEAIKDPALRRRYKAAIADNTKKSIEFNRQFELKYLDGILPKNAQEYLVRVYTKPPRNDLQLNNYLITYGISQPIRERILNEVRKDRSQTQR